MSNYVPIKVSVPEGIVEILDKMIAEEKEYGSRADFYEKAGYKLLQELGKLGTPAKEKAEPMVEE